MKNKRSPNIPWKARDTHGYKTLQVLMLFGAMAMAACVETAREDWPELAVLASASLRPVLVPESGEFEKMDGTRLNIEYLENERLTASLRSGQAADVILLDDWAALTDLAAEKIVLGDPWLFHLKREGLAVIVPEVSALKAAKPEDLLDPALERIGMVENGQGYTGRLTRQALHAHGTLKPLEPRLWVARSRSELAGALRKGDIAVGLVSEKDFEQNEGRWREGLKALRYIHWEHTQPAEYTGGIASGSADVKAARRYWNFIEKAIRVHQPGLRSLTHERM